MNNSTKIMILALASDPDKDYNYDGDEIIYRGSGMSIESAVYGAVMGLASTGLHQGFKTFVEGKNDTTSKETD